MAEQINLTVPVPKPSTASVAVTYLCLDWANARITIELTANNGDKSQHSYEGEIATTLMTQLNKVDLSTNSLQRRILARLIADGKLSGTISGTPD